MSTRAILLTAFNRPHYFQETLDAWSQVRGLRNWHLHVSIEPSILAGPMIQLAQEFIERQHLVDWSLHVNRVREGVLLHPFMGFQRMFQKYDFVLRAEDDLVVSSDALEFFSWASEEYRDEQQVGAVCAFGNDSDDLAGVIRSTYFSPLLWGTWRDRWTSLIGPTWDKDYSTFNRGWGHESGWDWNLNTRVFPRYKKVVVRPKRTRVDHIGVVGTHTSEGENHHVKGWVQHIEPQTYSED